MVNDTTQTIKDDRLYVRLTTREKKYYAALAAGLKITTSQLIRTALETCAKGELK